MTARLNAPVMVVSCILQFARSNVAPMLQEKELPDPRQPVVAGPPLTPQCKRARVDRREMLLWAHSDRYGCDG